MKGSDPLPPARNSEYYRTTWVLGLFGLIALSLYLPWLTGCAGLSSGGRNSGGQLTVSGTLSAAQDGVAYSAVLSVNGGKGPYTFSVTTGSLPQGLALGQSSGTISGTPTKSGSYTFTVQATDSTGLTGSNSFQITVSSGTSVSVTVTPGTATVASSQTVQFTAIVSNTSNTAVTWSASSGTISSSGMYTAPTVSSNTNATVTATSNADPTKSGTASLTITPLTPPALTISTTSLPGATAGTAYSDTMQAIGGTAPYQWTIYSGTLPTSFSLQSSGLLSGTTSQTGQFSITIEASDSSSPPQSATKAFTLTVNPANNTPLIATSFFGADFNNASDWPPTDGLNQAATLGGIRLWDDGVKWADINTSNGVYDFTGLDTFLGQAAANNMDVLYTFGDTPQFAAITTPPGMLAMIALGSRTASGGEITITRGSRGAPGNSAISVP